MVHDNYNIDVSVDAATGRVYNDDDDFTNDDAKRLLAISMMIKIAIPPTEHFISVRKSCGRQIDQSFTIGIFTDIFYEMGSVTDTEIKLYGEGEPTTADIIAYEKEVNGVSLTPDELADQEDDVSEYLMVKLYRFVDKRLSKHSKTNQLLWAQQSALRGTTEDSHRDKLLSKHIFYDNLFKFNFKDNLVSLLQSVVSTQLKHTIINARYKKDPNRVDNVKDAEGLSSIDKLEQSMVMIDETQVVKNEISMIDVIGRLEKIYGSISDDEIDYYSKYKISTNTFRNCIMENMFAKYFGGFQELRSMPDRYYMKLSIIAKRMLERGGYQQLPWLITSGVIGKASNRTLQSTKYITKVSQSGTYQHLMNDNYQALKGYRDNLIIEDLSKILNTIFYFVEYDTPEITGEPIPFNEDIISDEYMTLLDNV